MESNLVNCYLCGNEGTTHELAPAGSPALGHHVDFGMAMKWFCPDPCFERLFGKTRMHTDWEIGMRKNVHDWQDDCGKWARACVSGCLDETLREMETLPEGLKITPSEALRCAQLRDSLEDVEALQSDEDNVLLHKVCRNINHNPFHHPKTGMVKPYDDLVTDLRTLENLTPEERGKMT